MSKRDDFPHACGLFNYYPNGNTQEFLALDPPKKGEPCLPFHVVLRDDGSIPLSILVFARDKAHAKARVEATLRECWKRSRKYREERLKDGDVDNSRGSWLLKKLDAGELAWHIEPYDMTRMAAKINWAGNGGYSF